MAAPAAGIAADALLLVSHVLNELGAAARAQLIAAARRAAGVIWVEAGTHADSRRLIAVREELRAEFDVIAPCTHGGQCGMLAAANAAHWCHHFARAPSEASRDGRWAQFSRELGIDMRSLPYSFLVLVRRGSQTAMPAGLSRIIGRPREATGRMEVLGCDAHGVRELLLQKRDAPALFKALQKGRAKAWQHWSLDGRRIAGVDAPVE
jgi:ribosomal protein RSM22 (predicted rRNA methylase)